MRSLAVLAGVVILALLPAVGTGAQGGGGHGGGGHGGGGHGGGGRGGGGWHGGGGHGGRWHGGGWRGGGWRGGVFFRPRVFVGGFWDPFWFPGYYPFYYPYYYPYSYPVYAPPPPPPPDDSGWDTPPPQAPEEEREAPPPATEAPPATYGLIQLRGIPDGAAIDLDGRFWMTARDLDERWVALPDGEHTLSIKLAGAEPLVRRIDVRPGKTQVVRFGPFPRT